MAATPSTLTTLRACAFAVPIPVDASLTNIISMVRSKITEDSLANEILEGLQKLPLDIDGVYQNFVMDEEDTIFITMQNGVRLQVQRLSDDVPFIIWVRNVLSYADGEETAKDWMSEIVSVWKAGKTTSKRSRRSLNVIEDGTRLFIYCDVIRSSLCSDFRGRCLRILPYDSKARNQVLFPVYYYAVEQKVIDSIYVEILTKFGEHFPFPDHEQPVVAVLHFKKIS